MFLGNFVILARNVPSVDCVLYVWRPAVIHIEVNKMTTFEWSIPVCVVVINE